MKAISAPLSPYKHTRVAFIAVHQRTKRSSGCFCASVSFVFVYMVVVVVVGGGGG
jgi:hypothetical protein